MFHQKLKEIKRISDINVEDLIKQNIGSHLLRRNKQIKTRLLEAEKAERKQDEDDKRESKQGNKDSLVLPQSLKDSLNRTLLFREDLKRNNLNFKKYYKDLMQIYFNNISH